MRSWRVQKFEGEKKNPLTDFKKSPLDRAQCHHHILMNSILEITGWPCSSFLLSFWELIARLLLSGLSVSLQTHRKLCFTCCKFPIDDLKQRSQENILLRFNCSFPSASSLVANIIFIGGNFLLSFPKHGRHRCFLVKIRNGNPESAKIPLSQSSLLFIRLIGIGCKVQRIYFYAI